MAKNGKATKYTEKAGYLGPTFSNGSTDVLGDNWTGEALNLQGPVAEPKGYKLAPDPEGVFAGLEGGKD